jgi:nitrite reductase/ring-hydroxylating ferredoxin subunit
VRQLQPFHGGRDYIHLFVHPHPDARLKVIPVDHYSTAIPLTLSTNRTNWTRTWLSRPESARHNSQIDRIGHQEVYATANICTHGHARLCEGFLESNEIECPLHQGRFDMTNGKPVLEPVTESIKTFPVKIEINVFVPREDDFAQLQSIASPLGGRLAAKSGSKFNAFRPEVP